MNLQHSMNWLQGQLDQLNPRERTGVICASLALGMAILWGFLLEPALHTIGQNPSTQQALLQQASRVLQEADVLDALRQTKAKVHLNNTDVRHRLTQLLQEHGIAQHARLSSPDPQNTQVQFDAANAAGVLAWIAHAEALGTVRLQRVNLNKPSTGLLTGQVTLSTSTTPNSP